MTTPILASCPCNPVSYTGSGTISLTGAATVTPTLAAVLAFTGLADVDLTGDPWSGYTAVYPLDEAGTGQAAEYRDRTVNQLHGQGGGGQGSIYVPTLDSGIGCMGCQDFDGNDYISLPADPISPTSGLTVSVWGKIGEFYKGRVFFSRGFDSPTSTFAFVLGYTFLTQATAQIQTLDDDGVTTTIVTDPDRLSRGVWYHFAAVWTPGVSLAVFVNGVLKKATPAGSSMALPQSGNFVGRWNTGGMPVASIQELRITPFPRSAAWLKAEYDSVCGGNFVALG